MCMEASEIQQMKIEHGFQDGDYFVSDGSFHLCGFDYVSLKSQLEPESRAGMIYAFALTEDTAFDFNYTPPYVSLMVGKYIVKRFHNPIWIPRMDQLWEMISDDPIQNLWDFYDYMGHGYQLDDPYMMDNVKSIEVGLLMFVMKLKYNKKWNGTDWEKIE